MKRSIVCAVAALWVKGTCARKIDDTFCSAPVQDTDEVGAVFQNSGGSRPTGLPFATRSPVLAQHGMAATSQPLSTQVALDILKAGGSAVDAAIAANAMEGVVEPMMNGVGGDLMALLWDEESGELHGYNGAGRAPAGQSLSAVKAELAKLGEEYIPMRGPLTVTVPGAVRGWCDLSVRFGTLPLSAVLAPAIDYATNGFPVSEVIAHNWATDAPSLNDPGLTSGGLYPSAGDGFADTFLVPDSSSSSSERRTPEQGELFANPDLAATLQRVADLGCDDGFYGGVVAGAIEAFGASSGLKLSAEDLASHQGSWVEPIHTSYHTGNTTLYELPPNPQGLAALQILNILEGFDLKAMGFNSADYLHVLVEAKKLAFADASKYYADPDFASIPIEGLLSKEYAAARRLLINMTSAALTAQAGDPSNFTTLSAEKQYSHQSGGGSSSGGTPVVTSPAGTGYGGTLSGRTEGLDFGVHSAPASGAGLPPQATLESASATPAVLAAMKETLESKYGGDTVYLTVADKNGNMVSLIQSLYNGFGSGLVVPGLGFPLQDRGALFAVEEGHANVYAPLKRPFHTIMPGFAFQGNEPWLSFGVMGGFMQPQGQVQVLLNMVEFGMNVQEAGDAARFYHTNDNQPTGQVMTDGGELQLEGGVCASVVLELKQRGHTITRFANQGGYQGIERRRVVEATKATATTEAPPRVDASAGASFVFAGASEMRKDGQAAGY